MVNSLGYYNPVFYGAQALIYLKKALGMAQTVNRSYELDRNGRGNSQGEYVNIKSPSVITVGDAPVTAQSLTTGQTQLQLSYWREAKFKLTDKELAFTQQQIINDHIVPAVYELANDIESKLAVALKNGTPWIYALNSTPGSVITDITGPARIMFDNKVPQNGDNLFYMIDGELQMGLQSLTAFNQWQGAAATGVATQINGLIGRKFNYNIFPSQNAPSHTAGTVPAGDAAGAVAAGVGNGALGSTSLIIDDLTNSQTVLIGDTFVIAGSTQRYVVQTATSTVSSNAVTVTISPPLVKAYAENDVVTFGGATSTADNLMYHKDAIALVVAPLPAEDIRQIYGAKVETMTDPDSGLSIRTRMYYMPDVSEVNVAFDVLFGIKMLNPNLAVRAYAT